MGLVARYSHPHFSHSFTACRTRPSRSTSLSWTHGRPSFARTGFARWRLVSSGRSLQSAGARKGSTTTSPATLSLKSTSTWSGPTGRPGTASSITRRKRMHNLRPTHPGKTYSDARGKKDIEEDTTSRVSGLAFTLLTPHALVARQAGAWNAVDHLVRRVSCTNKMDQTPPGPVSINCIHWYPSNAGISRSRGYSL